MSEQKEYHPISFAYRDASEFDLYLPPKPVSSSLPLVIFFHGGLLTLYDCCNVAQVTFKVVWSREVISKA